jgi:hypothetical protein
MPGLHAGKQALLWRYQRSLPRRQQQYWGRHACRSGVLMSIRSALSEQQAAASTDLLILSNGPGELYTWVRPLLMHLGEEFRISIALTPCPHASGREMDAVLRFPHVARVLPPAHFWRLLLGIESHGLWEPGDSNAGSSSADMETFWRRQGVVLFLGGDQFFAGLIARRLGYPCVAYAEWDAMWPGWISCYAVRRQAIRQRARRHLLYRLFVAWAWILGLWGVTLQQRRRAVPRIVVIGDLTTDAVWQYDNVREKAKTLRDLYVAAYAETHLGDSTAHETKRSPQNQHSSEVRSTAAAHQNRVPRTSVLQAGSSREKHILVGLLPGSKPSKLAIMVPFLLLCAYHIHMRAMRLGVGPVVFVLPVAPGLDTATVQRFADPAHNSMFQFIPGASAHSSLCTEFTAADEPSVATEQSKRRAPHAQVAQAMPSTLDPDERNMEAGPGPLAPCLLIDRVHAPAAGASGVGRLEASAVQVPIFLHEESPAYALLAATDICLTTVGANTAELASLWTPALVLVPTHRLDVMRAWDGILGILCRLPLIGTIITILTNRIILWMYATRRWGYFALPNRWAGNRELLPELVGNLDAQQVAARALALALDQDRLQLIRHALRNHAQPSGAVRRLAVLVRHAQRTAAVAAPREAVADAHDSLRTA